MWFDTEYGLCWCFCSDFFKMWKISSDKKSSDIELSPSENRSFIMSFSIILLGMKKLELHLIEY